MGSSGPSIRGFMLSFPRTVQKENLLGLRKGEGVAGTDGAHLKGN